MIKEIVYIRLLDDADKNENSLLELQKEIYNQVISSQQYSEMTAFQFEDYDKENFYITFSLQMPLEKFLEYAWLFNSRAKKVKVEYSLKRLSDDFEPGDVILFSTFLDNANNINQYEINFENFKNTIFFLLPKTGIYYIVYDTAANNVSVFDITKFDQLCQQLGLSCYEYEENKPYKIVADYDYSLRISDEDLIQLAQHFGVSEVDLSDENQSEVFISKLNICLAEYNIEIDSNKKFCLSFTTNQIESIEQNTSTTYVFQKVGNNILVDGEYWLFADWEFNDIEAYIKINKVY